MADVTVAILGMGRVGTSFGLALKRYMRGEKPAHKFTITGYDSRGYQEKKAKELGALDSIARSATAAVEQAHIILLAGQYHEIEGWYRQVGPGLRPGAVVLDAAPLKGPSITWASEYLPQQAEVAAYMVGITPVLNPQIILDSTYDIEDADHAREDLFDDGSIILAPAASCPKEAVELAAEFVRIVGGTLHFMDPAEHDGLMGAMEGVPALVSLALFRALFSMGAWGDLRRLTNTSFGLATHHLRHNHTDALWALLHYNRENTARYLDELIEMLLALRGSLAEDEEGVELEGALAEAAAGYAAWEKERLANRWDKREASSVEPVGFFGQLGGALLGGGRRRDDDDDEDKD